jgi:hypothetical protein
LAEIEALPDFDPVYQAMAQQELQQSNSSRAERLNAVHRKEMAVDREISNLIAFIREGLKTRSLHEESERLEAQRDKLAMEREAIEREPTVIDAVSSMDELRRLAREAMARQANEPYEFGRIMHELIDKIVVLPYRLCDGGGIVLRAKFTLSLVSLLPPAQRIDKLDQVLRRDLIVDLFDPPQREAFRERVMALKALTPMEKKAKKLTEKQIAKQLGITTTAVQDAVALARMMKQLETIDPYLPVATPPDDYGKLRRHKHARYKFEPLTDADST